MDFKELNSYTFANLQYHTKPYLISKICRLVDVIKSYKHRYEASIDVESRVETLVKAKQAFLDSARENKLTIERYKSKIEGLERTIKFLAESNKLYKSSYEECKEQLKIYDTFVKNLNNDKDKSSDRKTV